MILAHLKKMITTIMIISDSTSIKVSGMVTAQRQRSDSARLAIKTFLHNFFSNPIIIHDRFNEVSNYEILEIFSNVAKENFPA